MARLGARRSEIRAAMGPAIGLCCFEVEEELAMQFAMRIPGAEEHRRPGRPGKAYLDLRGIVRLQLEASGLDSDRIESVGPCTRCANDRFFSRRAVGGAATGLQMSFIGIEA
jgi:copper oxidase (laccase) domain-containing protein